MLLLPKPTCLLCISANEVSGALDRCLAFPNCTPTHVLPAFTVPTQQRRRSAVLRVHITRPPVVRKLRTAPHVLQDGFALAEIVRCLANALLGITARLALLIPRRMHVPRDTIAISHGERRWMIVQFASVVSTAKLQQLLLLPVTGDFIA
jgi:hypothetical protein